MYYRRLGGTGLLAGEIGLNATALGDPALDDATAAILVQRALAAGANLIDTADVDGDGVAERRAGRAVNERREHALVATKGGLLQADGFVRDFSPAYIEHAARASLDRLGCGWIDLYQLHHPEPDDLADPALWDLLDRLRVEGIVRHIGVAAANAAAALAALETGRIEVLQVPFHALAGSMAPVLARARQAGVGVLAGSPLMGGVLAGRHGAVGAGQAPRAVLDRIRALSMDSGRSPAQTALGWVLTHEEVAVALPSPRTAAELEEALAASDLPLPSERLLAAIQHAQLTAVPAVEA